MQLETAWLTAFLQQERLPESYGALIRRVHAPLAVQLAARAQTQPLTVGLCGAQGSGKSTMAAVLAALLRHQGLPTAVLSIDDLYLTHAQRQALGDTVHPLLRTRGVPGTHDVGLGLATLAALQAAGPVALPAFDKSIDDRKPQDLWPVFDGPASVVILEGWCVGAKPQSAAALTRPINALERDEDGSGLWRHYVNEALAQGYEQLFAKLDLQVMLQAPSFDVVYAWRLEQEHKLRARLQQTGGDQARVMDDVAVARFIAHYERITRHLLDEMPARADILLQLDAARQVQHTRGL
jgi:D-glycerate 3-kinase